MQSFGPIVSLASLALSILVCVRLLIVARRTRGTPELAMGIYQLLIVLAIAIYAALRGRFVAGDIAGTFPWVVFANYLISLGVISLAIGVWRIYRPTQGWAMALCAGLSVWVLAGCTWTAFGDVLPSTVAATPANAFFVSGRSAVYVWGGVEGLRYAQMMKKRASLGLGNPMIAHQILLWGCFSLTMGVLAVSALSAGWVLGDAYTLSVPAQLITPAATFVASICLWLGFFPPAAYRRVIAGRQVEATA